ncbi:MAG: hypothetical protein NT024_10515 [Proteobacteria bacterium]|nr:hypothetical protein [Pseudomonadota bacterium]
MIDDRRLSDDDFVDQVRDALDQRGLAPEITQRLAAARHRAIAAIDVPAPRAPTTWVPASALAMTLLVVGLLSVTIDRGIAPPLEDLPQLTAVEDMDLLMNLEFVAWLDSDNVDAG